MILPGKHPSWMAVTFSPDGVIRSVAPGGVRLSADPASDLVGCHIAQVLAVTSVLEIPHMIQIARESGSWEGEISLRTADGESFSVSGRLAVTSGTDANEETFLLLLMCKAQKPDSGAGLDPHEVGARLRDIAHQLNNPLAVMMGYAQLVLMEMPAEGRLRADVKLIFEQTQRVAGMVERLRDYGAFLQGGTQVEPGGKRS
jgi:nitrogen-specific signal transduction histidine kinase